MAWLAVEKNRDEYVFSSEPYKEEIYKCQMWVSDGDVVELPKGSIKKLIGRELTWNDEPVELE